VNLSALQDVEFGDEEALREMLDFNALAHETIFGALLDTGVIIPHYPLFTMAGEDQDWRLVHAAEHRAIADALAISGPSTSFEDVNFHNQEEYDGWVSDHAAHHSLIAEALGI
jgi:hypothetical protein